MTTVKKSRTTKTKTTSKAVNSEPRVIETIIPDSYAPISMWGYFGYEILFKLPIIGWILCVCFAIMANNHNVRNFARAQFCLLIIYIAITCILATMGLLTEMFDAIGHFFNAW